MFSSVINRDMGNPGRTTCHQCALEVPVVTVEQVEFQPSLCPHLLEEWRQFTQRDGISYVMDVAHNPAAIEKLSQLMIAVAVL